MPSDILSGYLRKLLTRQKYHLVGRHSAVKRCKWYKDSMLGKGECYKARFYGIKSHQCMQSTCALQFCTQRCRFCWRVMADELGENFNEQPPADYRWDSPEEVLDGIVREYKKFAEGYQGNPTVERRKISEARETKMLTLSLSGEPTIYPQIGELLELAHQRGTITFLVSNGTLPETLKKMKVLPTQMYVSFDAPNREIYRKTCRPRDPRLWENYLETLDWLRSIKGKTRTVLRMTLVRNLNLCCPEEYAELIKRAQADYVEVKSFSFVGGARHPGRNLKLSDMLTIEEIREFAGQLADASGYLVTDEHVPSRVVLLCRDGKAERERFIFQKEK